MISCYQEREKNEEEERIRKENLLKGNPLLNQTDKGSYKIKKRQIDGWTDGRTDRRMDGYEEG